MKIRFNTTLACGVLVALATGCAQGPDEAIEPIDSGESATPAPETTSAGQGEAAVIEAAAPTGVAAPVVTPEQVEAAAAAAIAQESTDEARAALVANALQEKSDERARKPDTSALDLSYFNTREFRKRFAESFLSVTDVEPSMTVDESLDLQEIIELIQEGNKPRAMTRLQRSNNEAASGVFAFLIGQLHFEAERWDEALASYEEAIGKFSRYQRAWNNKALIHYQLGENEPAYKAFAQALATGKVDETTYGLMAVCLLNDERYLESETAFRQALMMNPGRSEWMQGLSRAVFMQGRYAEAVALFDGLIEDDPEKAEFWLLQGNALLGMGEQRRAAENFQIADQLGGSTNGSLNLLGDIYANEGLHELAVRSYIAAFDKDPDSTPDRALRSAARMTRKSETIESASLLLDGIQAHYGDDLSEAKTAELLKLRAKIAVRNGDSDGEVEILTAISAQNPLDGDALILLGEALERSGQLEDAFLKFETAARIDGFEAAAKLKHGQALVRAGRFDEAVPLIQASLQLEDKPSVRDFLEGVKKASKRNRR